MTADEFRAAQSYLGLSASGMAERLGVTVRAVRQFRSGERRISRPVAKLLRILVESKAAVTVCA